MSCASNTVAFGTVAAIIISIILAGNGLHSMSKQRNTGTNGVVVSLQQTGFSDCYATVNYTSKGSSSYTKSVYVPCDNFLNITAAAGLPIYLCYNRWNPDNVAYDDRGQHAGDKGTWNSPWNFCGCTGYGSAKAGIIAAVVMLSIVSLSWFGYAAYKCLPCPESGFKRFSGPDTQSMQMGSSTLNGVHREAVSKA